VAKAIDRSCEYSKEIKASGVIINTCGGVDGLGYELLLHAIQELKVNVVFVIDHEPFTTT